MARLNDAGCGGVGGHLNAGGSLEKATNVDGIDRVVRALVNHLQYIGLTNDRSCDLNATCAPPIRQGHFARPKRYLIPWNGNCFQNSATNHALGAFVQIGEVNLRVTQWARFDHVILQHDRP